MATYEGLSSAKAAEALKRDGPNSLPEKKRGFLRKLAAWTASPVSLMLLAAAGLSYAKGDVADSVVVLALFASNFAISAWHESKADRSIARLRASLSFKVPALRDGVWSDVDSSALAVGDVIALRIGSIVPADAEVLEATNLTVNESVLTGESLPSAKSPKDPVYSGSFVATGRAVARVAATGPRTSFGKTIALIDDAPRRSALEKDILSVSRFISIVSIVVIALLTAVLLAANLPYSDVATLDLSLLIAGIPVALPTVMSLIISVGVLELARKSVIVRRLASLEDLANVDLLLSDKTGTLTENKIYAERVVALDGESPSEVLVLAASAAAEDQSSPFDAAIAEKAEKDGAPLYRQVSSIPGDSERKRVTAIIDRGGEVTVSLGAAQTVAALCALGPDERRAFDGAVAQAAAQGYRTQAVAVAPGREERSMRLVGYILLADKAREDARETVEFMRKAGIGVKMVTGDNYEISKRVAASLSIPGELSRRTDLEGMADAAFEASAGFAEVLPKDKLAIVARARKGHVVAVTGDGVNDLPAVRSADVGFAVANAVDALKGTADIVLAESGIAVIKDAIVEARKIFVRLYNYSVYRISESFRLIITIAVIGLLYKTYPLTPVELIVLAFLNDVPIVSLAFDRVGSVEAPAKVDARERFTLSTLFGLVGVANSLLLLWAMTGPLHLTWSEIQTMFFLKLTVSGHMLIYVAHTKERWWRFLPSGRVMAATIGTQIAATALALFGAFTAPISLPLVALVWVWSFFWMQVSEAMKPLQAKLLGREGGRA